MLLFVHQFHYHMLCKGTIIFYMKFISNSMELSDEMLIEISYVKTSQYRYRVMNSLDGEILIPTQIAKSSEISPNHISRVLSELKEHELVECINPEVRKGRLYRLTDKGEELLDNIDCI